MWDPLSRQDLSRLSDRSPAGGSLPHWKTWTLAGGSFRRSHVPLSVPIHKFLPLSSSADKPALQEGPLQGMMAVRSMIEFL